MARGVTHQRQPGWTWRHGYTTFRLAIADLARRATLRTN
jgi:hypothetical protein